MRLTTKGRYAVTAMLDLALHERGEPVALGDISVRQGISLSYLEQLFARLRRGGLVKGMRGPGGGYCLTRPPERISVADVIMAVDESVDSTRCGGSADCQNHERCLTHDLWEALTDQVKDFLAQISLAEIIARHGVKEVAARQDRRLGEQRIEFMPGMRLDCYDERPPTTSTRG